MVSHNVYTQAAIKIFFEGARLSEFGLTARPGVNGNLAGHAVRAVLLSFEPKHEHKIAGAAFLLWNWFTNQAPVKEPVVKKKYNILHRGIDNGKRWIYIGEHNSVEKAISFVHHRYGKDANMKIEEVK